MRLESLQACGVPALQGRALSNVAETDLGATATGTTTADAYVLKGTLTTFTGGAANTGFRPPAASQVGDEFEVANWTGGSIKAYPTAGGKLNNAAADTATAVGNSKTCKLKCYAAGSWGLILSA